MFDAFGAMRRIPNAFFPCLREARGAAGMRELRKSPHRAAEGPRDSAEDRVKLQPCVGGNRSMSGWLILVVVVAVWVLLQAVVLPKLGFDT